MNLESQEKMRMFVQKLLASPAIASDSIIQSENQILSFVKTNAEQLKPTFKSAHFFPDLQWEEAIRLLLEKLTEEVVNDLGPKMERIFHSNIEPAIFQSVSETPLKVHDGYVDGLREFLKGELKYKEVRESFYSVFLAIQNRFYQRYIPEIIEHKGSIYNEIVRVDRMNLDTPQLVSYFNTVILFRPLFYSKVPDLTNPKALFSMAKYPNEKKRRDQVFAHLYKQLTDRIGFVPEKILLDGIRSNLNLEQEPEMGGCARLTSIMMARVNDFEPNQKAMKGAESPDKSWFNISRKNIRYNGFDARIMDELFNIAADNGW